MPEAVRRSARLLVLAAALVACLAPDDATNGDGGPGRDGGGASSDAAGGTPVTVTITAPAPALRVHRDYLYRDGSWVARVTYKATVTPPVDQLDWVGGGLVRGLGLPPDYAHEELYTMDGAQALAAVVHDARGGERGRADSTVTVLAPTAADGDCLAKLTALAVAYSVGPTTMGVPQPVTVRLPLNGMPVTAAGTSAPRTSLLMDCPMALALWRAADVLAAHRVTGVTDAGLYLYRCVSGTEQPPCAQSGFSLHAYGQAFDLAAVTTSDAGVATVRDDWAVDSGPTCGVPGGSAKNQRLHDVVCDLYANGIFTVVLSPNFSAGQQFVHLDLTAGQMVIK